MGQIFEDVLCKELYRCFELIVMLLVLIELLCANTTATLVTFKGRKVATCLFSRPQNFAFLLLILTTTCDEQLS